MCIIALKPEKVRLSREQLQIMWDANPHGAGFMYAHNGEVKVVKGLMTMDALVAAMEEVGPLRKMVLHFRIKTHGAISPEMTHPFWVNEGKLAMVHNGVIRPLVHKTTEKVSDTAVFAKTLAANYTDPLLAVKSSFHREMMEAYIGSSKMVFMDGTGETWILNEHLGEWSKNVWYSNLKYKAPAPSAAVDTMAEKIKSMSMDEFDAFLARAKRSYPNTAPSPTPKHPVPPAPKAPKPAMAAKNEFPGHFEPTPPKAKASRAKKVSLPEQSHWDRIPDDK